MNLPKPNGCDVDISLYVNDIELKKQNSKVIWIDCLFFLNSNSDFLSFFSKYTCILAFMILGDNYMNTGVG